MQEEKEEEPLCGDDGEFLKGRERERGKGDYKPCDYCNQHDYI